MSRFYKIVITKPDETDPLVPESMKDLGLKKSSYSSVDDDGTPFTSALDVALDIPVHTLSQPRQACMIRIFGIALADISQFTVLIGASLKLYGGMKKGLPLAKHFEPDLLLVGLIMWASGNWEGANLSLDLFVVPLSSTDIRTKTTVDLTFDWQQGVKLEQPIKTMLESAYGKSASKPDGYEIIVAISDQLVSGFQQPGLPYKNLSEFAKQLNEVTKSQKIKMPNDEVYTGVEIKVWDKKIIVYDGSKPIPGTENTKDKPLEIAFQDMIGQPTWKGAALMNFKTILRGDVQVGDFVKLPATLATPFVLTAGGPGSGIGAPNTTGGIKLPSKNKSAFKGLFRINEVRHMGQFRQADGRSWVTSFDATAIHSEVAKQVQEQREEQEKKTTPQEPFGPPAWPANVPQTPQGPAGGGGP